MRMGQGVRTDLGHGGITCVLQTQFSSFYCPDLPNYHAVKPLIIVSQNVLSRNFYRIIFDQELKFQCRFEQLMLTHYYNVGNARFCGPEN